MKLVLKLKLLPGKETGLLLRETSVAYTQVCNHVSKIAFESRTLSKFDLQQSVYQSARAKFNIPSQLAIRAIANVCASYKALLAQIRQHNIEVERFNASRDPAERKEPRVLTCIEFAPNTAVTFDLRVMTLDTGKQRVSLRTLSKRVWIGFRAGERREHLLQYAQGQADLKRIGKEWYFFQTLQMPEPERVATTNHLGVDSGICTIASSTDGCDDRLRFTGASLRAARNHHFELRRGLQRHNTKSSRRRVRKLRDREFRAATALNHVVSRRIVEQAKRTNSTVVLENLDDLREGAKVRKSQRRERFSWAYAQLSGFIEYKAKLEGIPVMFVPPSYTSKTCSQCHYMTDANRQSQAWFKCRKCGFCWNADDNAALNIRFLGAESDRHKRPVCMRDYLHTDRRKPTNLFVGT